MNIKKAKKQISDTVRAYLETDSYGRPVIPINKQRPLFLMGPPGIGKTEIMQQVAAELGIGLLSYSMTHHTRQSALGLPVIRHRSWSGEELDVSEYTVSEIIAAIYELMERTGIKKGILFLDEINCVSETLVPVMLQFLQYKVFGGRRVPDGWVVVTAGNPPEYNSSVREFDVVTWDRLKRIDVEPDLAVWKEFAYESGVHMAVLTYLEIKPQNFYRIETTVGGRDFVTARGWDDLSRILLMYEQLGIAVDSDLIKQYIQSPKLAEDFAIYYSLFCKYKTDYKIGAILEGSSDASVTERAAAAGFDERYALIGLLLETVTREAGAVMNRKSELAQLKQPLSELKGSENTDIDAFLGGLIGELTDERERRLAANSLTTVQDDSLVYRISILESCRAAAWGGFDLIKAIYDDELSHFKEMLSAASDHMNNMFTFCEGAFGSGQELLVLVSELAASPVTARFISAYGCEEYYRHDKELLFRERRLEMIAELEELETQE